MRRSDVNVLQFSTSVLRFLINHALETVSEYKRKMYTLCTGIPIHLLGKLYIGRANRVVPETKRHKFPFATSYKTVIINGKPKGIRVKFCL